MVENLREITKENLLEEVQKLAAENWRLISITGTDTGQGFDIIYHFDREMTLLNLRFQIEYNESVPSITPYYYGAFVPENELKDFHGIEVSDLPINYRQLFILSELTPVKTPLRRVVSEKEKRVKPE